MNADYNEEENDLGLNSIRRKYKGGRRGKNINYGVVLKTTKKEIRIMRRKNVAATGLEPVTCGL